MLDLIHRRLVSLTILVVLLHPPSVASGQEVWTWTDRSHKTRTREDLEKILSDHNLWLTSNGLKGSRADLSNADLTSVDLRGVDLRGAELSGVILVHANLQFGKLAFANLTKAVFGSHELTAAPKQIRPGVWEYTATIRVLPPPCFDGPLSNVQNAKLSNANFQGAVFAGASLVSVDMSNSEFREAHFEGAILDESDLTKSYLFQTHFNGASLNATQLYAAGLQGADFSGTNLDGARLVSVDLTGVSFAGANLSSTDLCKSVFEPLNIPPNVRSNAAAQGLDLVSYQTNPDALVQLRKQFEDGGFRTQQREVTYALNRRQAELDGTIQRLFKKIAFDWTCQYGMNPGRALVVWAFLLVVFTSFYVLAIHWPARLGVIYRVRKIGPTGHEEWIDELILPAPITLRSRWQYPFQMMGRELRVVLWGAFFSLVSASHIGFREINVGQWLWLLPRTEYDLKAQGYVRVIAGIQSIISLFLFALWVLTYFGRPFE